MSTRKPSGDARVPGRAAHRGRARTSGMRMQQARRRQPRRRDATAAYLTWATLPEELLEHIFSWLHPVDILRCACTCKHWQAASQQQRLWKDVFARRFPKLVPKVSGNAITWRQQCLTRIFKSRQAFMQRAGALTPDRYTGSQDLGNFLRQASAVFVLRITADNQTHNVIAKHIKSAEHRLGTVVQWTKKLNEIDWQRVDSVSVLLSIIADPRLDACRSRARVLLCRSHVYKHATVTAAPPVAQTDLVSLTTLDRSLVLGLWKDDPSHTPAFVALNVTYAALLGAVLHASETRMYVPPPAAAVDDDISTRYGMIDYHVVVQVRTLQHTVFLNAFSPVDCLPTFTSLGGGHRGGAKYAVLPLLGPDARQSHLPCDSTDTTLVWKCEHFSASLDDALLVDVVVRDGSMAVVAETSQLVPIDHQTADERRDDYAFSEGESLRFCVTGGDELGIQLEGSIIKEEDGPIVHTLRVLLSLDRVNTHFSRNYK
ncbi:hypothetical protein PTSG_12760 [Salpingoeca rosetta]|uniref:F-box domain-containing protein n=1 Tax=Salpingoeca rosetta (strain ATCC 50818 / BSB-021) TaxID=946362 RepID=F2UK47_SALR5|nr:uncharacterized protein PTSG_12760 [Salpingoeca rosetta]EGD77496.1 hypothetical protein PTSG_12760 [Salpingoeca rosetta]|eukprot:XP_004990384.1 hypothetical protein PTSG_12760 [Salpingoeca rosetta]